MKLKARYTFFTLSILFLVYTGSIYLRPLRAGSMNSSKEAISGRIVWQKYNCQSCHQLYSLGGYLGPDLTNIMSQPGKGEVWVRAMLQVGPKQMPQFHLTEVETEELIAFLKSTDSSGVADPRNFKTSASGMIESNGRN